MGIRPITGRWVPGFVEMVSWNAGTIIAAASGGSDLAHARGENIVGNPEICQLRMIGAIQNGNQGFGRKGRHMIDQHVSDGKVYRNNRKKIAKAFVGFAVNVIHNQIMDTVTLSSRGGGPQTCSTRLRPAVRWHNV